MFILYPISKIPVHIVTTTKSLPVDVSCDDPHDTMSESLVTYHRSLKPETPSSYAERIAACFRNTMLMVLMQSC